jgi:methylmalonyl-CoA mutase N-terminal domain/subunit
MKQAGASCLQEAAFTIANAIAYTDVCLERGLDIDHLGPALELHFCTEMDFFEEVAKYRAVRRVWTQLVRERFGAKTAAAQHFRLHAATSGRPLTARQPLNNIGRITLQALAQIFGGCEQTRTASFDEALAIPTEEAARTSLRINQIIAHETGIPDTVDPLGGSYYLESLTSDFVDGIREIIERIDEMGGALAATQTGYFQREIAEGAYREQLAVESGEKVVVGVNRFTVDDEPELPTFAVDAGAVERQLRSLRETRTRRDQPAVDRALADLEAVCRTDQNVMPAVLTCVRAYATTGEIADVWRRAFGDYVPETVHYT